MLCTLMFRNPAMPGITLTFPLMLECRVESVYKRQLPAYDAMTGEPLWDHRGGTPPLIREFRVRVPKAYPETPLRNYLTRKRDAEFLEMNMVHNVTRHHLEHMFAKYIDNNWFPWNHRYVFNGDRHLDAVTEWKETSERAKGEPRLCILSTWYNFHHMRFEDCVGRTDDAKSNGEIAVDVTHVTRPELTDDEKRALRHLGFRALYQWVCNMRDGKYRQGEVKSKSHVSDRPVVMPTCTSHTAAKTSSPLDTCYLFVEPLSTSRLDDSDIRLDPTWQWIHNETTTRDQLILRLWDRYPSEMMYISRAFHQPCWTGTESDNVKELRTALWSCVLNERLIENVYEKLGFRLVGASISAAPVMYVRLDQLFHRLRCVLSIP